jgi:hypothetical protein
MRAVTCAMLGDTVAASPTTRSATIEVLLISLNPRARSKPLLDELQALQARGVIRVVDAIVIRKDGEESVRADGRSGLSAPEASRIRRVMHDAIGFQPVSDEAAARRLHYHGSGTLLGVRDIQAIAEMLAPRESAVAIIIEHLWASRLGRLIRSSGHRLVEDYMLTPDVLKGKGASISMW